MFPEDENQDEILDKEQMNIYDKVRNQLIERSEKYEQQSDLDKLLNERIPIQKIAVEAKNEQQDQPSQAIALEESSINQKDIKEINSMPENCEKECNRFNSAIKNSKVVNEPILTNIDDEIVNILKDIDSNSSRRFGSDSDDTQLKDSNNLTHDRQSSKSIANP